MMNNNDPWELLGHEYESACCKGKTAKISAYDHTGYIEATCDCGKTYCLDKGASYRKRVNPNSEKDSGLDKIVEESK